MNVRKTAWTVATVLARGVNQMFFQFWSEIFAEFVENTENSIKFAVVIGVGVICICLIFTCKGTKKYFTPITFRHFFLHRTHVKLQFDLMRCSTCALHRSTGIGLFL